MYLSLFDKKINKADTKCIFQMCSYYVLIKKFIIQVEGIHLLCY